MLASLSDSVFQQKDCCFSQQLDGVLKNNVTDYSYSCTGITVLSLCFFAHQRITSFVFPSFILAPRTAGHVLNGPRAEQLFWKQLVEPWQEYKTPAAKGQGTDHHSQSLPLAPLLLLLGERISNGF